MPSTATHKESVEQETLCKAREKSMFRGMDQVLPLKLRASPTLSTATQKVGPTHETADKKSDELALVIDLDHELPLKRSAWPPTAIQEFEAEHETPASTFVPFPTADPLDGCVPTPASVSPQIG